MVNLLQTFNDINELNCAEFKKLESFHWEAEKPYRPDTFFKMGILDGNITAILKCYEKSPRAVFEDRDDPIYRDSCLEFFVSPVSFRDEYINVECNSKGAFLCEYGKGKYDRQFISKLTKLSPRVEPFFGEDEEGSFWGVRITLTKAFIADLFGVSEKEIVFDIVKANFYKCGDDCEVPHYLAFSPVTTLPPGFHNPECFAIFKEGELK